MDDFIVRIYRFEKDNPKSLVGLVEKVGRPGRKGFTNLDELWEILNSSMAFKAHLRGQKNTRKCAKTKIGFRRQEQKEAGKASGSGRKKGNLQHEGKKG